MTNDRSFDAGDAERSDTQQPDVRPDRGDRVIARQDAPEHGPLFWSQLDASLGDQSGVHRGDSSAVGAGVRTAPLDRTATMPAVQSLRTPPPVTRRRTLRWAAPLAAAAAVIAAAAIFLAFPRGSSDPSSVTEVVAAPTDTTPAAVSDGPADGDTPTDLAAPTDDGATTDDDVDPGAGAAQAGDGTAADTSASAADGDSETDASSEDQRPAGVGVPPLPSLDAALGAIGEPDHLPLDQGLPDDAEFLANWPERRLSWFSVRDPDTDCARADHSEIRYVNASGLTQAVRDPQPTYSGTISHFAVGGSDRAAWLVTCGTQAELYTATLLPTGEILDQTLAWFGQASASTALVQWDAGVVELASVEPGGNAFSVSFDPASGLVSRNGGPSRIILEAGAPAERSLTALAATPDAGLTYFAGAAPAGTISACGELFGSGQSDTLWLRQGEGLWQPAAGAFRTGTVTAAALETDTLTMAFADVCAGESGRVVFGEVLDDGRIDVTRDLDLTPFVPGIATQLHWVDETTLRIETDNAEFGFGIVRFDFDLESGSITQLD